MLQLQYIKEHTQEIIERLQIKNVQNVEERIAEILKLDEQRRDLQKRADDVKAEQNAIAKEIGQLFKQGKQDEANAKKARTAELKADEKALAEEQTAVETSSTPSSSPSQMLPISPFPAARPRPTTW